jgi:hypothetical protein
MNGLVGSLIIPSRSPAFEHLLDRLDGVVALGLAAYERAQRPTAALVRTTRALRGAIAHRSDRLRSAADRRGPMVADARTGPAALTACSCSWVVPADLPGLVGTFINGSFGEFNPDEWQEDRIRERARELLPFHPQGPNDCQIVAEAEADGDVSALVTVDGRLKRDLSPHIGIVIETPVECWTRLNVPRGAAPRRSPADGHPRTNETWWRWE